MLLTSKKERKVVYVDSLQPNASDNSTAQMIAKILFDGDNVSFQSAFKQRVQFDSNSCGVWMVSEMASYVLGLPEVTRRDHSFDICESLVERRSDHLQINETEACLKIPDICSDKQTEKFSTAESLVNVLSNDPENSEYFRQPPPKGIRTNFFYITDTATADINDDDNGAYNKT